MHVGPRSGPGVAGVAAWGSAGSAVCRTGAAPTLPLERPWLEIATGAVHVPDWLSLDRQRSSSRPAAAGRPGRCRSGTPASDRECDVGADGLPAALAAVPYTRTAGDAGGAAVAPIRTGCRLGRTAVLAAYGDPAASGGYGPTPH